MTGVAVVLAVLLVVAVLLGLRWRRFAREARAEAAEAAARAGEAALLAAVARRLLRGGSLSSQLAWIAARVAETLGADAARIEFAAAPTARPGERAVRLPVEGEAAWLYATGGTPPTRLVDPLAGIIDVSLERRRLEGREKDAEAARQGNLAKTAVLHLVSHDLRPMVHAVADAVGALADGDEPSRRARHAAGSATRLVDDLVDLSRIETGTLRPAAASIDLHAVVSAAAEHAHATHGEHPILVELPAGLPQVSADPGHVARMFENLLDNAVKFSPPDVPVRVTGGVGGGRATVRVIDRGPGIPAPQRARVFEPFFQGRPSDEGGGLGLAVSRGFAEANGGRLVLQSTPEGDTAFAVSLPLA